jgi:hypothetical protein
MEKKSLLDRHPLGKLGEEDLNMVMEFVLRSGSVKDLAAHFGVSYPTMRERLDKLIARLGKAAEGKPVDPMADLLADLVDQGKLSLHMAKKVRDLHRKLLEES